MSVRILCVDDEPMVLRAHRRVLEVYGQVLLAANISEAREHMERGVDILVTDLHLGRESGLDLLRWAAVEHPDVVRLLVSAFVDVEVSLAAVNEAGVFHILEKPVSVPNLRGAVSSALELRRLQHEREDILHQVLIGCLATLAESASADGLRLRQLVVSTASALEAPATWSLVVSSLLCVEGIPDLDSLQRRLVALPTVEGVLALILSASGPVPCREAQILACCMALRKAARKGVKVEDLGPKLRSDIRIAEGVVQAVLRAHAVEAPPQWVRIVNLTERMILDQDVHTADGVLLARGGTRITEELRGRLWSFRRKVQEPFKVRLSPG